MAAKISQEEREKQIEEACEGTIYSFIRWDGEYSGAKSRFICKCEKHGDWVSQVYSFITDGNRCKKCRYEMSRIKYRFTQDQCEQQIKAILESTTSTFIGWREGYVNQYSSVTLECAKHGRWERKLFTLLKSKNCPKCTREKQSNNQISVTQKDCENHINSLCEGTIYSFVKWKGAYSGISKSKFTCRCEFHGNYDVSAYSFMRGHRCRKCMGLNSVERQQTPREQVEQEIEHLCKNTLFSFLSWENEYKNNNSKFLCKCDKHGTWLVTVANFLKKGSRCPSCAVSGYQPIKKGTLYCLRSECGEFVKVGITNKPKQRFSQLKRKTPFDFNPIELFTHEDGRKALQWEKLFHDTFQSANLTGFDGCTEWLKWNPEIPLWFKFLT